MKTVLWLAATLACLLVAVEAVGFFWLCYKAIWTVGPDASRYGGTAFVAVFSMVPSVFLAGFLIVTADAYKPGSDVAERIDP